MIQRIQSFWLFLAALLSSGLLFLNFYKLPMVNGVDNSIGVSNHYPSPLLTMVAVILPLVTIFLFKNRKRQLRMCFIALLGISSLLSLLLGRVTSVLKTLQPTLSGNYWIGAILLPLSFICVVLAIIGIRKDDKLVKSTDRLR